MQQAYSKLDLTGRVIIVTGGGSGIGQETAKLLAARGAAVAVADVNDTGGEQTVAAISAAGGRAIYVRTDVSREAEVEALVAATVKRLGGLHGGFNNAGIFRKDGGLGRLSLDNWQSVIDINLTGVFLCVKHQIAYMIANGGGSIVNTASGAGLVGTPGAGAYCASKHGVVGLTRAASAEYSARGVRVNAIAPGMIETPMIDPSRLDAAAREGLNRAHPIGRMGQAGEIAEAAAWLLSEASSYVTGTVVPVDGGYTSI
ncbi:MAG: SDR family NAD(P)-dependent oxidoreductase [Sulfuricaulis sp.]|nr:SDR family NAD(P)-dependent oxidoreductase [Sulfuricaulis sp.]